jgi:hypothetical protein
MPDDGLGDPLARVEPPRDRWGRVLLPDESGKSQAYTRATTLAKALSGDKPGLTAWKMRLAVHGVVANRTLHNLVAVTPLTDKETLNDIVERALVYAGANDGATKGSTLHAACARARAVPGSFDQLPDDLKADVTAYAKCLTAHGVELDVDLIERMVVNDAVRSAGSFDDVVTVKGLPGRYVFDLKTAQDLSYEDAQAEIEIQLGVYANANAMVPKTWAGGKGRGQLEPMPDGISKDWAIVAHLAAGSGLCVLHWVNIARGWERAKLAFEARKKGTGFVAWGARRPAEPVHAVAVGMVAADGHVIDGAEAIELNAEIESVHVARDAAAIEVMTAAPPKRKRRSRAEIERDNAEKAKALMPALDVVAAGGPIPGRPLALGPRGVGPGVEVKLAQGPEAEADRAEAARLLTAPGPVDALTADPDLDAAHDRLATGLTSDADGTYHPNGTFTPDRFGDESGPDAYAVGDTVTVAGITFTKIGDDPFNAPVKAEDFIVGADGDTVVTTMKIDVSDAALDASLRERDLRVRDEILAERKRARIDREIRAAIVDATKPGTPPAQARKHLALAWDLWQSDWTDEHTELGQHRLAAL